MNDLFLVDIRFSTHFSYIKIFQLIYETIYLKVTL